MICILRTYISLRLDYDGDCILQNINIILYDCCIQINDSHIFGQAAKYSDLSAEYMVLLFIHTILLSFLNLLSQTVYVWHLDIH